MMTEATKAGDKGYQRAYCGLESQIRGVARMAAIARGYANEIEWPKGLTEYEFEEVERLLFLVGHIRDMAEALVKTYDAAWPRGEEART